MESGRGKGDCGDVRAGAAAGPALTLTTLTDIIWASSPSPKMVPTHVTSVQLPKCRFWIETNSSTSLLPSASMAVSSLLLPSFGLNLTPHVCIRPFGSCIQVPSTKSVDIQKADSHECRTRACVMSGFGKKVKKNIANVERRTKWPGERCDGPASPFNVTWERT